MRAILACGIVWFTATTACSEEPVPAEKGTIFAADKTGSDLRQQSGVVPLGDVPSTERDSTGKAAARVVIQVQAFDPIPDLTKQERAERDVLLTKLLNLSLPKTENDGTAGMSKSLFGGAKSDVVLPLIESLHRKHLVEQLAEVKLTTENGQEARFFAGGEFSILVPQNDGKTIKQRKKFGTEINIIPWLEGDGKVRIQWSFEHSARDYTVAVRGPTGEMIPGLNSRKLRNEIAGPLDQTILLRMSKCREVPRPVGFFQRIFGIGEDAALEQEPHEPDVGLLILITPSLTDAERNQKIIPVSGIQPQPARSSVPQDNAEDE